MGLVRKYFSRIAPYAIAVGLIVWLDHSVCQKRPKENKVDRLIDYIVKTSPQTRSINLGDGTKITLLSSIPGVRAPFGTSNARYHVKIEGKISLLDLNSDGFDSVTDEYLIRMGAREYFDDKGFSYKTGRDSSFKAIHANWKRNEAISDITSKLGL